MQLEFSLAFNWICKLSWNQNTYNISSYHIQEYGRFLHFLDLFSMSFNIVLFSTSKVYELLNSLIFRCFVSLVNGILFLIFSVIFYPMILHYKQLKYKIFSVIFVYFLHRQSACLWVMTIYPFLSNSVSPIFLFMWNH